MGILFTNTINLKLLSVQKTCKIFNIYYFLIINIKANFQTKMFFRDFRKILKKDQMFSQIKNNYRKIIFKYLTKVLKVINFLIKIYKFYIYLE